MTPQQLVIQRFGGTRKLATILNISHSSVVRWRELVPAKYHIKLLEQAKRMNIELSSDELIYGGKK